MDVESYSGNIKSYRTCSSYSGGMKLDLVV